MVATELLGLPAQHDLSVREDEAAIGDRQRQLDVLLDEDDAAAALLGVRAHDGKQPSTITGARPRLSSSRSRSFGMPGERPPDREHLLLTAGEQAAAPVASSASAGKYRYATSASSRSRAVAETQVLGDREPEEQAARLRDVRDAEPCPRARLTRAAGRCPSKRIAPLHRVHEAGDGAQRRRLPAPLAPSSATTSPGATSSVEVADHRGAVVAGGQAVDARASAALMSSPPRLGS